jgi:integrase
VGPAGQRPGSRRRAGGRRRYHAIRQARAWARRARVLDLLGTHGLRHGAQAAIARILHVSQATVSRDVAALIGHPPPQSAVRVRLRGPGRGGQ